MSRYPNKILEDNSQGKYITPIWFTFEEVSMLRKFITAERIKQSNIKHNKKLTVEQIEEASYKWQILGNCLSGLIPAFDHLKMATAARKEGRYKAAIETLPNSGVSYPASDDDVISDNKETIQ